MAKTNDALTNSKGRIVQMREQNQIRSTTSLNKRLIKNIWMTGMLTNEL
ncbi:hypothetical protein [Bacillus cereus]|nr:hypothetical protein [Bacillus cereus]